MEQKPIELSVRITAKELFVFMLHHTYSSFSGIAGLALSIVALIALATGYAGGDATKTIILILLGAMFTVINPVTLYSRAVQQVKDNPMYKRALVYVLDEEGISLEVGGKVESLTWDRVIKCKKTKTIYALYTTKIHAVILPVRCFKNQKQQVEELIKSKVRGR